MTFNIVDSSPKAKAVESKVKQNELYPFDQLNIGQSFTAPLDEINWKSLRICVYQRNAREAKKAEGKQFAFIKHDDLKICEVARIA